MKNKPFFLLLFFASLLMNFSSTAQKTVLPLQGGWTFRQTGTQDWLPATVPGCVHTDLLDNKKIDDPFYRTNEEKLQWIGEKDWEYATTFNVDKAALQKEAVSLVFRGLDTYADVFLNGEQILAADNMHRTWKVDVKSKLKESGNRLQVYFHNVFAKAGALRATSPLPQFQFANNDQADTMVSLFVRKAGYHFGWDWGPRLVTAGIWKDVAIEAFNTAKLDGVHISTTSIANNTASLHATANIQALKEGEATFTLQHEGKTLVSKPVRLKKGDNRVEADFTIANPTLWWSNGLGKPTLYTFAAKLEAGSQPLDAQRITTGIRTLKVVTEKDQWGRSLYVELNGVPVFMKGANYIPTDNFTNRFTDAQYEQLIKSAADVNMNMLRIWGGGYFEKDIFYDLCDRYGILLWHDMLFACGTYPANESYLASVAEEVKDNIRHIRNHPSVALYNGNNEVEVAYYQWDWKKKLTPAQQQQQEAAMHRLFYEVIPQAIASEDPTRYYHPTSPNTGYNDIPLTDGDVHYWSVWHGKEPFESYNTNVGRFMSEYGFQSYPEMETVKSFTLPEDRELTSAVMQAHQRCMSDDRRDKGYGNRLIKHYMDQYYREPKNFEQYLYVSQLLQEKGMQIAIEAHRRNMPKCMGTLYWQINDCWPVASWSSIDYYGRWKAAHYKVRDLYKDILVTPIEETGKLQLYVVSDRLQPLKASLEMVATDLAGKPLYKKSLPVEIAANTSKSYFSVDPAALLNGADKTNAVLTVRLVSSGREAAATNYYFAPEKSLQLSHPSIRVKAVKENGKYRLTLSANKLAKDVFISVPGVDGAYTDNYFDLLPGRPLTVYFTPKAESTNLSDKFLVQSLVDSY